MKKSALSAALLLFGVGLSGCPVYSGDGCSLDQDCAYGYVCDDGSGSCVPQQANASPSCNSPDDCGMNETCDHSGTCVIGDCHFASVGCVTGYACGTVKGHWQCVAQGPDTNGGATSGGAASASGGEPATTDGGASAAISGAGG